MPPLTPILPMLAPPDDDSRRKAFCKKPGCPDLGEGGVCGGDETSCLLTSFALGATAAPKGFGCSADGLWAGLPPGFGAGIEPVDEGLALDENFELMLVIHELRLPREPMEGDLESFAPLVDGEAIEAILSELSGV
ncbi:MAG: hypothetical protein Q9188_005575 [Gyalolechia gomerana]